MRSFWDNERFELSSIFMMTMLRDLTNSHDSSSSSHFCFCSSSYSFFLSYSTPVLCAQVFFSLLTTIFIACEARLSSTTMSSIIPQAILVKSNYFKGGEGKGASLQFRNVHFWSHPLLANSTYLFTCDRLVPQSLFNTKVALDFHLINTKLVVGQRHSFFLFWLLSQPLFLQMALSKKRCMHGDAPSQWEVFEVELMYVKIRLRLEKKFAW